MTLMHPRPWWSPSPQDEINVTEPNRILSPSTVDPQAMARQGSATCKAGDAICKAEAGERFLHSFTQQTFLRCQIKLLRTRSESEIWESNLGEFSERAGRAAAVGVGLSGEDQEARLTRWLWNTDLKDARGRANSVHWGSCSKWQEQPVPRSWGRKRVAGTRRAWSGQGAMHVAPSGGWRAVPQGYRGCQE